MTSAVLNPPTPGAGALDIRFYQIAAGKGAWYAITAGKLLVSATRHYGRAAQYYAWERGVPRSQIGGPTHRVADVQELSVSLANQEQEGRV
jgi:hypothetical protein